MADEPQTHTDRHGHLSGGRPRPKISGILDKIDRIDRVFVFPFLPLRKRGKKLNPATPEARYPRPITPYHAESTLLCFPTKSGLLLDSFFRELAKATKKHPEDPAVPSEMPLGFYFTGVNPVRHAFRLWHDPYSSSLFSMRCELSAAEGFL
jgi:hypothetical protein